MVWYRLGATYKEIKKAVNYILKRYHKYKKLWNKQFGEKLLEHVLWDHIINLKPKISLKFYPTYKLMEME